MALKATGIVIPLKTKLLIVDDSVMVVFQAPGDGDASPGAAHIVGYRGQLFE
jgi:hypothetical protein